MFKENKLLCTKYQLQLTELSKLKIKLNEMNALKIAVKFCCKID